jgi:hypothetical protein
MMLFNVVGIESLMNQTPLLILDYRFSRLFNRWKECFKFDPLSSIVSLFDKIENNFNLYRTNEF